MDDHFKLFVSDYEMISAFTNATNRCEILSQQSVGITWEITASTYPTLSLH